MTPSERKSIFAKIDSPSSVLRHSRDSVCLATAGLPDALIPTVTREFDGTFPVLARVAGTQTGATMELITNSEELVQFTHLYRESLYFTHFIDFRSSDGFYRKFRVRVIGDSIVPNHLFFNEGWKVHGHASRDLMANHPWMLKEEEQFILGHHPAYTERVNRCLREIHARIGTDFYGIDFAILDDGRLLLFEANAAMRSIYPEWRETFPLTATVTSELVKLFRALMFAKLSQSSHLRAVTK